MKHSTKKATFTGGPLNGMTRDIETSQTIYEHEQPAVGSDIRLGEVPSAFMPPIHEYIYEESPAGSGNFVFKEQHHQ